MTAQPERQRTRLPLSDRRAAVARLDRLAAGARPTPSQFHAIAHTLGTDVSTVRRWWQDPALRADAEPETARRGYVASVGDLTVLADARSGRAAYERLVAAGLFKGAYSTDMRGLRRADPALLGTAIEGWPGLLKNRPYLDGKAPHRGHTLHLDHTQLDVFVWPSHRHHQPVKPWVTGVADSATGLLMVVPWELDVTDQKVSAALLS